MQVKKFEAKSMKEALDLVKVHMGPEAIILSAKDNNRGFGLIGEKSVEVTAAISDETLRRKKIADSKMREDLRTRFHQIPAAKQKQFINRVFDQKQERRERETVAAGGKSPPRVSAEARASMSGMRYIDILDFDEEQRQASQAPERPSVSQERVRRAAEAARQASLEVMQGPQRRAQAAAKRDQAENQAAHDRAVGKGAAYAAANNINLPSVTQARNPDVRALESQVQELKTLVERFQKIPQIPMSIHPGGEQGLSFELSPAYQRLTQQGVDASLVTRWLKQAQQEMDAESIRKPSLVDAWLVRHILGKVETTKAPMQGRYHVFMGCTGQGKTTTLVKFASHLILKERKTVAIISLDTIKVGAADQLRIYAQILNVPFAIVRTPEEWAVAEQKLGGVNHILVDCPGFNLNSMEEVSWLKHMLPPAQLGRTIHYVQSALARDEETMDIAGRYQMLQFNDVIFTRLDESSRNGLLLNFQERFRVPFHSFGTGSGIPEDYEFAHQERVVDFLFKISKVSRREEKA